MKEHQTPKHVTECLRNAKVMTSKGMPASGSRTQKVTVINAIKHPGLDPRMG